MNNPYRYIKHNYKEIAYQVVIILVLFIFFAYNQTGSLHFTIYSLLELRNVAFFGNYIGAAIIINYVLLPNFYYKKREILFFISVVILITLVILIDEYVLEQIYYPDTRGTYFPGFLFTLIETLPVIIITVAFKFAWDFNRKQSEIEKLKTLVKESELQFLKSQINPHFLFNNLNNLYAHAIKKSSKTPSIILELSSVLRYMLYDCKENFVPLAMEIKNLKGFTTLYELQIGQRGSVQFHTEIPSADYAISPLILIVFIENAFKHSTESQSKNILIDIQVKVSESGLLTFTCDNSFLPDYGQKDHSGIGLENVKKRLLLLYPKAHLLNIKGEKNTYHVELKMQLKPIN
ncbi:sensor histidine kinase [Flexithrix dorotheae]|uniref:sensor histidine kinase n=1 Tax=Flexithrix dorotheae TaxID=70993 RepID=UPI00037ABA6E|nr:histidine kinase [Flexithrix dorotheae]